MKRYVDHDQIVEKNRATARSYETDARDKSLEEKGYNLQQRQQEASCFNCKMKQKCPQFRSKRTGGTAGVVSFGGDQKFICNRYMPNPAPSQSMSAKQVKSLLKNAKRGLQ
jgi:cell division septum initiation protein DivIVA